MSTIAPVFAQTANNTLTISWTGGTGTAKSGTITSHEGQPKGRIVPTDTDPLPQSYPTFVTMGTNDGGVRGPASSFRSSTGGLDGAIAGVGVFPKLLRPGKYTAVGDLSKAAHAGNGLPEITQGNLPFVDVQCLDEMSGTFTLNSITVEQLPQRLHVMKLSATIDGSCSANGAQFHVTMSADEPSLGGVIVDPPADDGSGGSGGTGGTGGSGGTGGTTPTAPTIVLPDNVLTSTIQMPNSGSTSVSFSTFVPTTTTTDVTLTAATDANDLLATITPSVIKSGDTGNATVTIQTTATTRAGEHVVTLTASDGTVSSSASIHVTVFCDPPFILGLDQPKSSTVSIGRPALLSVKASGSGPFTYQWFTGASGLVNFPLAGGTTANFTTSAINDTSQYWVRITNPCGSVASQTATVNVAAQAKPNSRR